MQIGKLCCIVRTIVHIGKRYAYRKILCIYADILHIWDHYVYREQTCISDNITRINYYSNRVKP